MKIAIETLGCLKNANDSELAAGILEKAGHQITKDLAQADAVMVNTCGFINDAKVESIDKIFEVAREKKDDAILIVSGCLSQRYGEELYKQMPEADIFLGVNDYKNLPDILADFQSKQGKREKFLSSCRPGALETEVRKLSPGTASATIKIAEGCNNRCTYCVIPSIRGGYRSKTKEDILKEAQLLAENGCKELILIAQDVTAYGLDLYGVLALPTLLKDLCLIKGIQWIRLMYCYEDRITDELIEVMRDEPKICKYIDIPLQHCSDKILRIMNRRSTRKTMETTIHKLRSAMPDIHIRTTFITGFPGEGREEFEELLDFVETMRFERMGVFAYSKEEGTPAATMKNQVRRDVKERRKETLMRKQLDISLACNTAKIGQILPVIVEEQEEDGTYLGRSIYDAPEIDNAVIFTTHKKHHRGDIIIVQITDAFDYDLVGKEVSST